jgi:fucose permease
LKTHIAGIIAAWIPTFLLRLRHTTPLLASLFVSAFWAGMALGRILLGPLTDRTGERLSVSLYLLLALLAHLLFSLTPSTALSLLSITALGFFLGPLFPTGIVMITRLMPRELHVGAVATVAAVGQVGGALFPFGVGVMAERWGIQALRPVVFGLLGVALGAWWCFPRLPGRNVVGLLDGRGWMGGGAEAARDEVR